MERKRSIGVTIFGWLFIISGIFGLFGPIYPHPVLYGDLYFGSQIKPYTYMFIFSKLMSLCGLIAGVYILKLKNWARKLQITLRLISIAFIIFTSRSLLDKNMMDKIEKTMEGAYDLSRQKVIERYKPEHQEEEIKKLEFGQRAIAKGIPIILFSTLGTFIIWEMLIIFFFTRSKVKEQFD